MRTDHSKEGKIIMKKVLGNLTDGPLVVCLMVFFMSLMACAKYSDNAVGLTEPTDLFIEACDNLFAEDTNYKVIDENGCDVTEQFLEEHRAEYLSDDYVAIENAVIDTIKYFTWEESAPQPQPLINRDVYQKYHIHKKTKGHKNNITFDLVWSITGNYKFYDHNERIPECNAELNIEKFSTDNDDAFFRINDPIHLQRQNPPQIGRALRYQQASL